MSTTAFDPAVTSSAAAGFSVVFKSANEKLATANASLDALRLPIGWRDGFWSMGSGETDYEKVLGLALTAIAISLGAPFWFDALSKLANLRSAGGKPPTGGESPKSGTST